jgi:hypothetical protein
MAVVMMQRLGGKIDRPEEGADSCAYAHCGAGDEWSLMPSLYHDSSQSLTAGLASYWLTITVLS